MPETTCLITECDKPRHQGQKYCASHYMKKYRYGDPFYQAQRPFKDLAGKKFGALTALRREGGRWVCACDCGVETVVRPGDLNRGSAQSCGHLQNPRLAFVGYEAAHQRVQRDRGLASEHKCADCGTSALHWSYDHQDPDEQLSSKGLPYSLDSEHYQPRCVPCHKVFDLGRQ